MATTKRVLCIAAIGLILFLSGAYAVPTELSFASFPLEVDAVYDTSTHMLLVTLTKDSINARIRVFTSTATLFQETVVGERSVTRSIPMDKQNVMITIDDLDAQEQLFKSLDVATPLPQEVLPVPVVVQKEESEETFFSIPTTTIVEGGVFLIILLLLIVVVVVGKDILFPQKASARRRRP